ncbi:MAG: zinc-dependent metalloprotease [Phycisphaerales bacterium JB039]
MRRSVLERLAAAWLVLSLAAPVWAQEETPQPAEQPKAVPQAKQKKDDSKVKPYDEVIPEGAISDQGLFTTHRVKDKLFYEIPPAQLDLDMLWVTQVAETQEGAAFAGAPVGDRVVRWEQRGEQILLRDVRYQARSSDPDDPINIAVEASSVAPIIQVFDIAAWGKDKAAVIEVTDLFTKDVPEFSASSALGARSMDSGRSFIEEVKSFPENINVKALCTYSLQGDRTPRSSAITALIHHSMVKLPEDPMEPRIHDERVGFFSVGFTDYGDLSEHETKQVRYITRWRLEKKDPDAELSDPVKPIVWYVGRGVPEKWKPYVKAGIEQWQPAFESAGFSNAIIGKYAPDPSEDPDWDAEDARITTIRWLPSTIENAFGPHVHDPRTGEILEADVRMYHNIMKLVRDWYFVQAAASDERAQKLPMPDDLMGELIQFVVAHEVGHSLGLPHNFKASSAYTVEQLRDPEWTKKNGTAPSIMDYARFNYVAQPEDGAGLLPQIGPYDHFSIEWGYRQFPQDASEQAELEKLVKKQIDEPMFRFGSFGDPTAQTEDLGADAVEATRLGLKNLERIAGFIVEATGTEGKDYDLLSDMYDELLAQWNREMGHVVSYVGGVEQINLYYGDAEQRYFPVAPDQQRKCVEFLIDSALVTPEAFIGEDIIGRLTATGVAERVLGAQSRIIRRLVSQGNINRMAELAERGTDDAYTPAEMLADLRAGLFSEFSRRSVEIDLYRRNLQRSYIDLLAEALAAPAADSDLPGLARSELEQIRPLVSGATNAGGVIGAHAKDLTARIDKALKID